MIGSAHSKFLEMVGQDNGLLALRRSIRNRPFVCLKNIMPLFPFHTPMLPHGLLHVQDGGRIIACAGGWLETRGNREGKNNR